MNWQFTLAGLLVGILVGTTGMGGGSLMTPILILLFGFDAKVAVGTDILHGAIVIDVFAPTRDDWAALEPLAKRPPRWPR